MKTRLSCPVVLAMVAGMAVGLSSGAARAQQTFFLWNGPVNGLWNNGANWSPIGVPNAAGHVVIIPGGGTPVLNISATLDKFGMGPGSALQMANGSQLIVRGQTDNLGVTGIFGGEGVIAMNSAGAATDLIIAGGAGHFAVHGNTAGVPARITATNTQANRIYGQSGLERLVLGDVTLFEGSAQIGVNLLEIENYGTIRAVGSQGITIDPNGAGVTNHGVLAAISGNLTLTGGTFRNIGLGAISSNSAPVIITGARVEGGLLDTATLGLINVQGGSTLADCRLNGTLAIPNGGTAFIETAFTFGNGGSFFNLASAGAATDLVITTNALFDGQTLVSGIQSSNTQANRIYSQGADKRLTIDRMFIRGSMQLGVNLMSLTISPTSVVEAMGTQGITIDPNGDGVLNQGLIAARDSSSMLLTGGTFHNADGRIIADAGGTATFSGADILGGQLLAGGGVIFFQGLSVMEGVASMSDVRIPNGHTAFLRNSYVNNNSLAMNSGGAATDLRILNDTMLSGSGVLSSSNTQANRVFAQNNVDRLTNAAGHTIRGAMQLGVNLMALTNNGLIEASGTQGMVIDPNAGGVDNNSTIRALTASGVSLANGTFDNLGGVVAVQTGATGTLTGATLLGGQLTSAGTGFVNFQDSSIMEGVTSTADVRMPNGHAAFLRNTYINNGTLAINSAGAATDLRIINDTMLSGSGILTSTNTLANRVFAQNNLDRLTNAPGHTIRGSMQLGVNLMALTNNGLIEASGTQGMVIDPNAGGVDNNSMIRALTGSSVSLANGTFDNADGVVAVQTGATGTLTGATLLGGQLTSAGTGFVVFQDSSIMDGVTSTADVRMPNGHAAFLRNTYINNGTLGINSGGAGTDLRIIGNTIVSGAGSITSTNTLANRVFAQNNLDRLTNAPGHTIRGAMQLGVNLMAITNQGTIDASLGQGINIDPNAGGFDNQGTLIASGGNIAILDGPFTTSGTVIVNAPRRLDRTSGPFTQTGGTVQVNGELEVVSNVYELQGGTLSGTGVVDSNVVNSGGVLAPGTSPGVLRIEGTYTQQAGGVLDFEVGSTTDPALNDRVDVIGGGSANLGGTVRIRRLNGFIPPIGQGFSIITTAPNLRFGTFSAIDSPDFWHVEYLHNVAVAVFDGVGPPDCAADFNGDGNLDPDDLGDYINCYFAVPPCDGADFNADGNVDPDDLGDFINAYFAGC